MICGNTYQFRLRADNEGVGQGIEEGIWSEWSDEAIMPDEPVEEDDDEQSFLTKKTETTYIESDEEEDDSLLGDLDDDNELNALDIDILNRPLPSQRKGGVLLKSTGTKGEVENRKAKGVERRGGVGVTTSLEPGSF